jgi:site-specific recombinase XerD
MGISVDVSQHRLNHKPLISPNFISGRTLRHIYAIETLRSGASIYRVSQHLGHTSVKTTEQFYLAHLTADEADRARG